MKMKQNSKKIALVFSSLIALCISFGVFFNASYEENHIQTELSNLNAEKLTPVENLSSSDSEERLEFKTYKESIALALVDSDHYFQTSTTTSLSNKTSQSCAPLTQQMYDSVIQGGQYSLNIQNSCFSLNTTLNLRGKTLYVGANGKLKCQNNLVVNGSHFITINGHAPLRGDHNARIYDCVIFRPGLGLSLHDTSKAYNIQILGYRTFGAVLYDNAELINSTIRSRRAKLLGSVGLYMHEDSIARNIISRGNPYAAFHLTDSAKLYDSNASEISSTRRPEIGALLEDGASIHNTIIRSVNIGIEMFDYTKVSTAKIFNSFYGLRASSNNTPTNMLIDEVLSVGNQAYGIHISDSPGVTLNNSQVFDNGATGIFYSEPRNPAGNSKVTSTIKNCISGNNGYGMMVILGRKDDITIPQNEIILEDIIAFNNKANGILLDIYPIYYQANSNNTSLVIQKQKNPIAIMAYDNQREGIKIDNSAIGDSYWDDFYDNSDFFLCNKVSGLEYEATCKFVQGTPYCHPANGKVYADPSKVAFNNGNLSVLPVHSFTDDYINFVAKFRNNKQSRLFKGSCFYNVLYDKGLGVDNNL